MNFDFSEDRLDLSDWPMLYDAAALTFTPTTWGVIISHHSEAIYLRSADLAPLYENDFTSENFIFA